MIKYVNEGNLEGVLEQIKRYPLTNRKIIDNNGNSLVGISTCKGDLNMVKLLIKSQFEINLPNKDGNTPLHFSFS